MSFRWKNIQEFNKTFDLQAYVAKNFRVDSRRGNNYILIECPFHSEDSASCAVYTDSYYCFGAGCGAHGDSFDFVQKVTGLDVRDILNSSDLAAIKTQASPKIYKRPKNNYPLKSNIVTYNAELFLHQDKLNYLYNRHFNKMAIGRAWIGYDQNTSEFSHYTAPRYIIPVFDQDNKLISARYRIDPVYETVYDEPKYLAHPNAPTMLYNSYALRQTDNIIIVGSELDAAFLYYKHNIYAVAPPGEGNFKQEWSELFKDKNVLIWYDYDGPGIQAAIKTYNYLKHISHARIYQWPNGFNKKDDICDFVTLNGIEGVYEVMNQYDIKAYSQLERTV